MIVLGNIDVINRAVYSSCAVIIKLNQLTPEALAIAKGIRSVNDISDFMKSAWNSGQKMRVYFTYADLKASTTDNGISVGGILSLTFMG